jgi:hypothetical protein
MSQNCLAQFAFSVLRIENGTQVQETKSQLSFSLAKLRKFEDIQLRAKEKESQKRMQDQAETTHNNTHNIRAHRVERERERQNRSDRLLIRRDRLCSKKEELCWIHSLIIQFRRKPVNQPEQEKLQQPVPQPGLPDAPKNHTSLIFYSLSIRSCPFNQLIARAVSFKHSI